MLTTGILFLSLWAVSSAQGKSFARMISFSVLWVICIVDFCLIYICWTLKGHSFTTAAANDFFQQNNGFPRNFLSSRKAKILDNRSIRQWYSFQGVVYLTYDFRKLRFHILLHVYCNYCYKRSRENFVVKTKRPLESNPLRSPCPRILPAGPRAANSFGRDGKAT